MDRGDDRRGERMDFSSLSRPTADKHSTGGVGDKITLPLAPLVAVFGVAVPQLSGRGLGHTGGTLDKLESIPGWRAALTNEEMLAQLEDVGAVICAAGSGLAPADKKLYALRDVTGTVEAIPLIASSIMSKKIAEGTGALVLDVKVGSGAFMKTRERRRASSPGRWSSSAPTRACRTVALLTDMPTPLGLTAGNALEVRGVGRGARRRRARRRRRADRRPRAGDARLRRQGRRRLAPRARRRARDGRVAADDQGAGRRPRRRLPTARESHEVLAQADGVADRAGRLAVGVAAWRLGAGRARKEDPVQAGAGIVMHAKPGATVRAGERLMTLHTDTPERFDRALEALEGGWTIAPEGSRPDLLPSSSSASTDAGRHLARRHGAAPARLRPDPRTRPGVDGRNAGLQGDDPRPAVRRASGDDADRPGRRRRPRVVLVASYGGHPTHPQWYANMLADPRIVLTGRGRRRELVVRTATAAERAELWPRVVAAYDGYRQYQARTDREIPLVICE